MKYSNSIYTYILAGICFFGIPAVASAVSITATVMENVHAGDTFVVQVSANTEGQNINSIEGDILFSDRTSNFEVRDISVAGSGFSMWPRSPSLSPAGDQLSFAGGIPGGVSGQVPLFKVVIHSKAAGEFRIGFGDIVAYANDGKGTQLVTTKVDKVVTVLGPGAESVDQWNSIISSDNTSPQPFQITMHQDPELYNGQKFISFPTVDNESGIAYYEVQEGNTLPVRTGDQYVLVDQKSKEPITVTAFDLAGNSLSGVYTGKTMMNWYAIVFWVIVLLLIKKRKAIMRGIRKINIRKIFKRNVRKDL